MFKLSYIDAAPRVDNAFSQFGTFVHKLLEEYFKGEKAIFELSEEYSKRYDQNVKLTFPPNDYLDLTEAYLADGQRYFDEFEGIFPTEDIVAVEEKVETNIGGREFVGVIDLVVKDGEDYIICDHKTKKKFKTKKERKEYLRQLYLYAYYIQGKYQKTPVKLVFNLIRGNMQDEEKFSAEDMKKAVEWFTTTVQNIYADEEFKANVDDFFCNELCSVRHSCNFSNCFNK